MTKMASEMMKVTVLGRNEARQAGRRREIGVSEIHEKGYGNRGSAFGRIWETRTNSEVTTTAENSIIAGGEKKKKSHNTCPSVGKGTTAQQRMNGTTEMKQLKRKKKEWKIDTNNGENKRKK